MVDPARLNDYSKYTGATAITPNRVEAEAAAGLPAPRMNSIVRAPNACSNHSIWKQR